MDRLDAQVNNNLLVTVLIPHYKTLELTKLCLRSIRKYTDLDTIKVIVIDNDSQDESTHFLRTLKWITLIERPKIPGEKPIHSHSKALDLGLERSDTRYVLSIHTDTIVTKYGWLDKLLTEMNLDPRVAGVGSGKLEYRTRFSLVAKRIERFLRMNIWYRITGSEKRGVLKYLRSHCAMYRTDVIRELQSGFSDGEETAGRVLHQKMIEQGYQMRFIPDDILAPYVKHLGHATQILNPELNSADSKNRSNKAKKRILREFEKANLKALLSNSEFDSL